MATINFTNVDFTKDAYPRNLARIALEIKATWKNVSIYAEPYLNAMLHIHSSDKGAPYYADDAQSVVAYFLANAQGYRGEAARRIKKELKEQYGIK